MKRFWNWVKTKGWPWILGILGLVFGIFSVLFMLGSSRGRRVLERQIERTRSLREAVDDIREATERKVETTEALSQEKLDENLERQLAEQRAIDAKLSEERARAEEEAHGRFKKDQPASDLRAELDALINRSRRTRDD